MSEILVENFDSLTFDEWVDFVFEGSWLRYKGNDYFGLDDLNADINIFAENCIKLFQNPAFLLEKFDSKQLENGFFDFILSPRVSLNWWVWDIKYPSELRRKLILESVNVFKEIFAKNPLEHSCFMWWDCLRNFNDEKDLEVMKWMFEALSEILKIDSVDCQMSALHGLGHIEHSEKKDLIKKFLKENPNFTDKEYASAAIIGHIL